MEDGGYVLRNVADVQFDSYITFVLITGVLGGDDEDTQAAGPEPVTCSYVPSDTSVNPDLTDVGVPDGDVPTTGTQALTMTTNYGVIGLTLDQVAQEVAAGRLDPACTIR